MLLDLLTIALLWFVAVLFILTLNELQKRWRWYKLRSIASPLQRGQEWKKDGHWRAAIKEFGKAVQADSRCVEAYMERAECFLKRNNTEAALADLNQVLILDSQAHRAYLYRATIYGNRNKFDAAVTDYHQAFLIYLQDFRWWFHPENHAAYSKDELDKVIMVCDKALSSGYIGTEEVYLSRGCAKMCSRDVDGAREDFNEVKRLNPQNPLPMLYQGSIHLEQKEYEQAVGQYDALLSVDSAMAEAYFQRGYAYYYLKEYEKALSDFNTALKLTHDHHADIYFWRGTTYGHIKNYDQSVTDYEAALAAEPSLTPNQKLNIYLNHGMAKHYLDDNDSALLSLNKALEIDPNLANAYFWRGQAYQYQHNWYPAIADYTQAINLKFEKISRAYFGRGYCYLRKRDLAAALADYNEVIRLNPDQLGAYNNRACVYAARGDLELALADCNQILNLDSSVWFGYENRGYVYFLMGRYDDALADFQKALAIKADHAFAVAGEAIVLHAVGRVDEAKTKWQALLQVDAKYQNADALQDEYNCAEAFVAEARKIAAL